MAQQPILFKHVGSYTLLFFLSVFNPFSVIDDLPFSLAPLTVLATLLLLIYKIKHTLGFTLFWQRYRVEIVLIVLYQAITLASLLHNSFRYNDTQEFVNWGLTFIIVQGTLPMAIFLYLLPQNESGLSLTKLKYSWVLPPLICIFIGALATLQKIDYELSENISRFFIASYFDSASNIRSVFAISTDLGAISAIMAISYLFLLAYALKLGLNKVLVLTLFAVVFGVSGGLLSGSRVFLAMFGIGILLLSFINFKERPLTLIILLFQCLLIGLLFVSIVPLKSAIKITDLVPVALPLNAGLPVIISDIFPQGVSNFFSDRIMLWTRAIEQVSANPLLGISNGGFRLIGESVGETKVNNTHNILVQAAVDGGILGLSILLALIFTTYRKIKSLSTLVIFCICFACLMVDNFVDHSLPWIIIASAALTMKSRIHEDISAAATKSHFIESYLPKILMISCLFTLLTIISIYSYKRQQVQTMDSLKMIETAYPLFSHKRKEGLPIIMAGTTGENLKNAKKFNITKMFSTIAPENLCNYLYPDAIILFNPNEVSELPATRLISSDLALFDAGYESDTHCQNVSIFDPQDLNWISNHEYYFRQDEGATMKPPFEIRKPGIVVRSPLITILNGQQVSIKLKPKIQDGEAILIEAAVHDIKLSTKLSKLMRIDQQGTTSLHFDISSMKGGLYYLSFKLKTPENKAYRQQSIEIQQITLSGK
ncbi:MAG: O-antigen ligase family protein [Aestuariibacter sp.]